MLFTGIMIKERLFFEVNAPAFSDPDHCHAAVSVPDRQGFRILYLGYPTVRVLNRKVTICPLVQLSPGLKVVDVVPFVILSARAQRTAP